MDRKEYSNKLSGRIGARTDNEGVITLLRGISNRVRASSINLDTNNKQASNRVHHAADHAPAQSSGATVSRGSSSGGPDLQGWWE
jgi:hypothetical protein